MALTYIPDFPEGIAPFISLFYERSKNELYLLNGDAPLKVRGDYYTRKVYGYRDCRKFNYVDSTWTITTLSYLDTDNDSPELIYTNHDIYDKNAIVYKKTSDSTEIKIADSDTRNMKKGMVWNLGKAVSVIPSTALQSCSYESSNSDVCTVDETGKIVAVGEGECIITISTKVF